MKNNNELASHIAMLFGAYKLDPLHNMDNGNILLNDSDQRYIIQCINSYDVNKINREPHD